MVPPSSSVFHSSWKPASESTTSVPRMRPALSCGWTQSRAASLTPEPQAGRPGVIRPPPAEARRMLRAALCQMPEIWRSRRTKCLVGEDESHPNTPLRLFTQQPVRPASARLKLAGLLSAASAGPLAGRNVELIHPRTALPRRFISFLSCKSKQYHWPIKLWVQF